MRLQVRIREGGRIEIAVFVGADRVGRIRGQIHNGAPGLPPRCWVAGVVLILPRFRGDGLGARALAEAVAALRIPAVSATRAHGAGLVSTPSPEAGEAVWRGLAGLCRVEDGVAYPAAPVVP